MGISEFYFTVSYRCLLGCPFLACLQASWTVALDDIVNFDNSVTFDDLLVHDD